MTCDERLRDLALYAGGDLKEEAARAIEKHLRECPACRDELEALKKALHLASSFAVEAPPVGEFLSGVRSVRARAARRRLLRYSALAASMPRDARYAHW